MKLIIFALILLYPISTFASEENSPWYQQYQSDEKVKAKKIKSFAQIIRELERRIEQRQKRQQRAPQYPTKK